MRRIVDIVVTGGEHTAICKQGANQHAHILLRKSIEPSPRETENSEMSIKHLQTIAAMSDVTKAYFVGLDETSGQAFLEKSAADRDAEAQKAADEAAAKAKKDDKMSADEKKKADEAEAAKQAREAEAAKTAGAGGGTVTVSQKEWDDMQKNLKDLADGQATIINKSRDLEYEKRASMEFRGYPGGSSAVVDRLKAIAELPEATRKGFEEDMRRSCDLAKATTSVLGFDVVKTDGSVHAEIEKRAGEIAKTEKISIDQARAKAVGDLSGADLEKALDEEAEAFAAAGIPT